MHSFLLGELELGAPSMILGFHPFPPKFPHHQPTSVHSTDLGQWAQEAAKGMGSATPARWPCPNWSQGRRSGSHMSKGCTPQNSHRSLAGGGCSFSRPLMAASHGTPKGAGCVADAPPAEGHGDPGGGVQTPLAPYPHPAPGSSMHGGLIQRSSLGRGLGETPLWGRA